MIDVNDLDGLLELAKDYVEDGLHFLTEPVSYGDLVILVERVIAAEKDAARYRWLRNDAYNYLSGPMIFNCDYCGNPAPDDDGDVIAIVGVEVDLAIDEAMRCNK